MRNTAGRGGPCVLFVTALMVAATAGGGPVWASSVSPRLFSSPHAAFYYALPTEATALAGMDRDDHYAAAPRLGAAEPRHPGSEGVRQTPSIGGPPRSTGGLSVARSAIWGGISVTAGVAAFEQSQSAWGQSRGKFHFKHDFKGDHMAMSDESSHAFAAYHLMQVVNAGYRWIGMDKTKARRLAALEAWLWMFAVEYPIDACNPDQGFGVSDMLFNTAGVLAAYHRSGQTNPRWDVKISVKQQFLEGQSRVIAYTTKQYDDYIYWVTLRPLRNRYVPLLLGAGYSTSHLDNGQITKELNLGIGTSLSDIGGIFGQRTAAYLRPLDFFFFNLRTTIGWR